MRFRRPEYSSVRELCASGEKESAEGREREILGRDPPQPFALTLLAQEVGLQTAGTCVARERVSVGNVCR